MKIDEKNIINNLFDIQIEIKFYNLLMEKYNYKFDYDP